MNQPVIQFHTIWNGCRTSYWPLTSWQCSISRAGWANAVVNAYSRLFEYDHTDENSTSHIPMAMMLPETSQTSGRLRAVRQCSAVSAVVHITQNSGTA